MWGLLPLYWHRLDSVSPWEILAHRAFWSFLLFGALMLLWRPSAALLWRYPLRLLGVYLCSGLFIGVNWALYIWAVHSGHVLQASLGYFLNPLANVLVGALVLGERLAGLQRGAVACAAVGVLLLLLHSPESLWISLLLTVTFCLYGLTRKQAPLDSLTGMYLETAVLAPLAVAFLSRDWDRLALLHQPHLRGWLVGSGLVTALPLLLFSQAARSLTLASLGMFQYLSPTLQFALAVGYFREPFTTVQWVSFGWIWLGLALYTWPLWRRPGEQS